MDLETVIMELVVNAGNARSLAIEAVRMARQKDFQKADKLMEECKEALNAAHAVQTDLIRSEMEDGVPVSLLLVHAQDHVMNAMTVKDLAAEMIEMKREEK